MRIYLVAIAGLAISACTASERPARAQEAVVPAGDPVSCIETNRIRNTNVIDDQTIDFHMNNGDILRNTLPNRCPSLGFEKSFAYKTSIARLCNVDIITVLYSGGGVRRGASCGLGEFQPIKKAETKTETGTESSDAP